MNQPSITDAGASRGSLKSYLVGFVLCLILTAVPFALVMSGAFSPVILLIGIFGAGVVQIFVHLHYFLHLDASSGAGWNLPALIFTLVIMIIFIGGSIWIMYDLNYRMM